MKMIQAIVVFIVVLIFGHFCGSYYNANLNITEWSEECRFIVAFFSVTIASVVAGFVLNKYE